MADTDVKSFLLRHKAEILALLQESEKSEDKKDILKDDTEVVTVETNRSERRTDADKEEEDVSVDSNDEEEEHDSARKHEEDEKTKRQARSKTSSGGDSDIDASSSRVHRSLYKRARSRSISVDARPSSYRKSHRRRTSRSSSSDRDSVKYSRRNHSSSRDKSHEDSPRIKRNKNSHAYSRSRSPRSRSITPHRYYSNSHRHHTSRHSPKGSRRDYNQNTHQKGGSERAAEIRARFHPEPTSCLGIFGMPPWIRHYDLTAMFEPFGKILQLNCIMNKFTGECKGFGFVYFSRVEDAKRAREAMRNAKIDGVQVRVDYSTTNQLTVGTRMSSRER